MAHTETKPSNHAAFNVSVCSLRNSVLTWGSRLVRRGGQGGVKRNVKKNLSAYKSVSRQRVLATTIKVVETCHFGRARPSRNAGRKKRKAPRLNTMKTETLRVSNEEN